MAIFKKLDKIEFVAMIQDYQKRCCINGHWQRGQWSTVRDFEQYYAFGIERNFDKYTLTGEVTTELFQSQLDKELENDTTPMQDLRFSFIGAERLNTWDHDSSLDQTLIFEAN